MICSTAWLLSRCGHPANILVYTMSWLASVGLVHCEYGDGIEWPGVTPFFLATQLQALSWVGSQVRVVVWDVGGRMIAPFRRLWDCVESISVPTFRNWSHSSSSYIYSVISLCSFTLISGQTRAVNPGFSLIVSEYQLMTSNESTIFCTGRSIKFTKAANRRLWAAFWLRLIMSSTGLFIVSSRCTRMQSAALRARSCSVDKYATRSVLTLAGRSSKTTWSKSTRKNGAQWS